MALIRSGRLMRNRPRSWLEPVRREAAWRTKCSSLASQDRSGKQPVRQQGREGEGRGAREWGAAAAAAAPGAAGEPLRADRKRGRPGGPEQQRASGDGQVSREEGKSQCAEPGEKGRRGGSGTAFPFRPGARRPSRSAPESPSHRAKPARGSPRGKDGRCRETAPSRPFFPPRAHRRSGGEQPEAQQVLRGELVALSVPNWPASLCLLARSPFWSRPFKERAGRGGGEGLGHPSRGPEGALKLSLKRRRQTLLLDSNVSCRPLAALTNLSCMPSVFLCRDLPPPKEKPSAQAAPLPGLGQVEAAPSHASSHATPTGLVAADLTDRVISCGGSILMQADSCGPL